MRSLLLVTAAAFLAAGCDVRVGEKGLSVDIAQGKATDEWVRTYTLPANGRIEIGNVNGIIEVLPAQGREVEVRAEREVRSHSDEAARELLQKLDMREEVAQDRVKIEAAAASEQNVVGFGRRSRVSIRYRVRVPGGLTVAAKTQNGAIRVQNVNGRVEASSVNGGVTVEGLSGSLAASVVNGGLRVDLAAVTDDVKISSTNGGVGLDLPTDIKAELDAVWVNGGVTIDPAFGIERGDSSARQLRATLNGGGPRISVSTVNGGVRIRPRGSRERD